MINTLDDVVEYTQRRGKALPELRDEIVVTQPGCSDADMVQLTEVLPGLPDNYLSVIRRLKVNGVSIGSLGLGPFSSPAGGLVESLIEANEPGICPFSEYCQRDGVYWVASWEADPIGVAHAGSRFGVGQLVIYNIGNVDQPPRPLAEDFEQFLLLAATLQETSDTHRDDDTADAALAEFRACAQQFTKSDAILSMWDVIAGVVLGR
jgi:hypothetical protein